jgi:hypothetical protein
MNSFACSSYQLFWLSVICLSNCEANYFFLQVKLQYHYLCYILWHCSWIALGFLGVSVFFTSRKWSEFFVSYLVFLIICLLVLVLLFTMILYCSISYHSWSLYLSCHDDNRTVHGRGRVLRIFLGCKQF